MQFNRVLTVIGNLTSIIRAPGAGRALEIDLADLDQPTPEERAIMGLWVSDGGTTRLALRPNGRYDKKLGIDGGAYSGRYEVDGSQLYFESDTGRTAIATARRGVLTLGYHRFVRPNALRQGARSSA